MNRDDINRWRFRECHIARGDTVVVVLARLRRAVAGTVRGMGSRALTLRRGDDVMRIEWSEIVEIARVPQERAEEVARAYTRACSEHEDAYRRWYEQRERALAEFRTRWERQNPYPEPPRLSDFAEKTKEDVDSPKLL